MITKYLVSKKPRPSTDLLARFTPFDRLSAKALEQAADACAVEEIPPGKLIFKPGVAVEDALFLIAGEITLISDDQVIDTVAADTEAARGELAPERPQALWGWSTTRVTLLRAGREPLRALAARARPRRVKAQTTKAAGGAGHDAGGLQERLKAAEAQRLEAESRAAALAEELQRVRRRLEESEAALASAREQLGAQQAVTARLQAIESERDQARSDRRALAATLDATRAELGGMGDQQGGGGATPPPVSRRQALANDRGLPALRIDPAQRATLAPEELEGFHLAPLRRTGSARRGEPAEG